MSWFKRPPWAWNIFRNSLTSECVMFRAVMASCSSFNTRSCWSSLTRRIKRMYSSMASVPSPSASASARTWRARVCAWRSSIIMGKVPFIKLYSSFFSTDPSPLVSYLQNVALSSSASMLVNPPLDCTSSRAPHWNCSSARKKSQNPGASGKLASKLSTCFLGAWKPRCCSKTCVAFANGLPPAKPCWSNVCRATCMRPARHSCEALQNSSKSSSPLPKVSTVRKMSATSPNGSTKPCHASALPNSTVSNPSPPTIRVEKSRNASRMPSISASTNPCFSLTASKRLNAISSVSSASTPILASAAASRMALGRIAG
mmetsp:Transcript_6740/g.20081  ORF Transcript_6740/g.20081 Transcript_6740/m.20081 type:complete len:315 (-) Transcript_6740:681-1625(-)